MATRPLILVVEDDRTLARGLLHLLERNGYRSVAAHDGLAAVEAAARRKPSAVLLDVDLPGITGIEAARRMRAAGYSGPVLMVTAQGSPLARVIGLEAGANDYVTKPFDPRELLARIAAHLPPAGPAQPPDGTRLRSVVFSDLVGFSRRMAEDERSAIALLERHARTVRRAAERRGGRVVETRGDEALVLFDSERDAVAFSLAVHRECARRSAGKRPALRMAVRMGIHSGDVTEDHGAARGTTVNIAARLRELATEGSTVISAKVRSAIRTLPGARIVPLGGQKLKNIRTPVEAYRIRVARTTG
jgi:DNA-binding response OmpR family regulator